jgi:iron complex outermembrane receptor protein
MHIQYDWEKKRMSVNLGFLRSGTSRHALIGAALALSAATLALSTAGTAVAQDQPTASPVPMEEIVVTGSRIRTSDVTAANPLTVVTAQQIQQTEAVSIEQYFRKLPDVDFTGGVTANDNNGGAGASLASLRNLGPQRTLILVNGVRFPLTDYQNNISFDAVDTNNIPIQMIDHIEILKDGASSLYGADAIGGVINFITKKNFNGIETGGSVGETSYGDGLKHSEYVMAGGSFDRGNILINVSHDSQDPVIASARPWAVDQHTEADINNFENLSSRVTGAVGLIGSGAAQQSFYFPHGFGSGILSANAYKLGATNVGLGVKSGGGLSPLDLAIPGAGVFFNVLPAEGLVEGLERTQANFSGDYEIAPNVKVVFDAFYTNRQSNELLNPEPLGYNTPTPQFPLGLLSPALLPNGTANPFNPTNQPGAAAKYGAAAVGTDVPILTRRFENGPRTYTDDINTYRLHVGLEGTIYDDYDWSLGYAYGKSAATYNVGNETNFYHVSQELGMNACGTAVLQGCSVANFFGYNTLTKAQANYLSYTNTDTSQYDSQDVLGSISGPVPFVPELPAGAIKGAVGFEYLTQSLFDHPDAVTAQGDGAVFTTPTQGGYSTASVYAEINIPILKDLDFAKSLDIDASARYDYNTTFGRALTHKVGVNWAVDDDIRFRGGNSTGFRAPQLKELYGGLSQGEFGGADVCQPGGTFAGTAACLSAIKAAGANPKNVPVLNQITALTGGNPALHPEVSQEWTAGMVFTPTAVKGLAITVDYYTILIRNDISAYDVNLLQDACYGGTPYLVTQAQACALVGPRLAGTGTLGPIKALNANIGAENTDGIDVSVAYSFSAEQIGLPLDGSFTIDGQANYLMHDDNIQGNVVIGNAGTFNGDDGEPRWKALLTLGYAEDNWSVQWTSRYYGGLKDLDRTNDCEFGTLAHCPSVGAGDFEGNETAGVFYHDISASYQFHPVNVTVGVDNLFDKDPPFLFPTGQTNAAGSAGYDFLGRFVYMKVSAKLGEGEEAPAAAAAYTPPPAVAVAPSVPHSYLVFFDFNKSDLTPQAVSIVNQAATNAGPAHVTQLTVTGHTDTVGSDAYNMRLSRRRAESVASQLEKDGIASSEIEIVAKGKRDLLVPTADGVKEPQNRRVQIVYSGGPTS